MVTLREVYKVSNIAPGHCTGEPMFAALQKAFGPNYIYAGLGTSLQMDRSPQTNGAVKFLPSTIATPQRTGD